MAQVKISELPAAATIVGSDVVSGVESATTKKIKAETILMVKSLTAVRYKTIQIFPEALKLGGVNDPDFAQYKDNGAGSTGVFLYHFDKAAEEEAFFSFATPPDYKEATDMYLEFKWVPKVNGGVGLKVCWGVEHTIADEGEIFGAATLHYQDTATIDEDLVQDKHYRSEINTHPGAGLKIGHIHVCRLFRDATGAGGTDDYDNDAVLLGLVMRYQVDGLGAATKDAK